MKFVSRNTNLGIVLKPGFQGNAQLGTTTVAGIFARFKDGTLETSDEWVIEKLMTHPGYKVDYFVVEEGEKDPYSNARLSSEPTHVLSDMQNGHPHRITKSPVQMTPETKKALMDMATELAKPMAIELSKQMLPSMVAEVMKSMVASQKESSEPSEGEPVRKAGRPKKVTE